MAFPMPPLPADEFMESVLAKMPDGLEGFGKTWGFYDFARKAIDMREAPLLKAAIYAKSGLDLTYDAIERRLADEALLHAGHHAAMLQRAIEAHGSKT